MKYLKNIAITLPNTDKHFENEFNSFFKLLSQVPNNLKSAENYFPKEAITFSDIESPKTVFTFDDQTTAEVSITNETGKNVQSPHQYDLISLNELTKRSENLTFSHIDHMGFNLPWFEQGIHPEIGMLREKLKRYSLYHTFPTGEPWDFILPGAVEEIEKEVEVDYKKTRRPKFEIVSFDKCSTPLIQIDIAVTDKFITFAPLFSEGIIVKELSQVWVYVENNFGIDICFVINQMRGTDWSSFFKGHRI